jgi:Uncharacterized protein conserved in bacteria (DUF2188)
LSDVASDDIAASAPIIGKNMSKVVYKIVEHDGGWAYKVGDVFSEPFTSHAKATAAARRAAAEQRVPGRTEVIQYEDADGNWHEETARGDDRPSTDIVDEPS